MFEPTFENSTLEKEAKEVCGDDKYCLFDVAATKKVEIGMATMEGGENFEAIVEMSVPSMFEVEYCFIIVSYFYTRSCSFCRYNKFV